DRPRDRVLVVGHRGRGQELSQEQHGEPARALAHEDPHTDLEIGRGQRGFALRPMFCMSRVASPRTRSTMSSTVTMPLIRPCASTTGTAISLLSAITLATAS